MCVPYVWKGQNFSAYMMPTIGITLKRWREIMGKIFVRSEISTGFTGDTVVDGRFVEQKTNETFDNELDQYLKDTYFMWSTDQRQFALRFDRWKNTVGR